MSDHQIDFWWTALIAFIAIGHMLLLAYLLL